MIQVERPTNSNVRAGIFNGVRETSVTNGEVTALSVAAEAVDRKNFGKEFGGMLWNPMTYAKYSGIPKVADLVSFFNTAPAINCGNAICYNTFLNIVRAPG